MKKIVAILKEELVFIPVMMLILYGVKIFLANFFPDSAQFDIPSEVETITFSVLRLTIYTSLSWLIVRIVFPAVYKYLRDEFYQKFLTLEDGEKRKISFFIFFAFLFALIMLSSCTAQAYTTESALRKDFIKHLNTQLNVREKTGHNDGKEVEVYLKTVGLNKGAPWCAAFTSANLNDFKVPNPMSGYSPNFAKQKDIIWSQKMVKANKVKRIPQPGDCFTLFFASLGRVAHVGFVVGQSGIYFLTIEGNTNGGGSRDGDGVYCRKRDMRKVYAVTNYITPYFNQNEQTFNSHYIGKFLVFVPKHKNTNDSKNKQYVRYLVHRKNNTGKRYTNNSTSRWHEFSNFYSEIRHDLFYKIRSCIASISIQEWTTNSRLQMRCLANIGTFAERTVKNLSIKNKRTITIPKRYSDYKTSIKVC